MKRTGIDLFWSNQKSFGYSSLIEMNAVAFVDEMGEWV
jgi:hypothetical protein